MYRGVRVAVVVPAYQEAMHISRTLDGLPDFVDRVFVVDDASTDHTAALVQARGEGRVTLFRHTENRGVGAAIATGYARALEVGAEVVAVMGGDGQMDPCDLAPLLDPLCAGDAGYAKGNRLSWPGAHRLMPPSRWLGNHILSWLTRRVTGLRVHDSQCGYTAVTREGLMRIELDRLWPRYGYPNDLLGAFARADVPVAEVPVRPIYAGEKSGIRLRHALFVIPFVLLRVAVRRVTRSRALPVGRLSP